MKRILVILLIGLLACTDTEESELYTTNKIIYTLQEGSQFPISGTITFRERISGELEATIALTGTEGDINHPAHLHYGSFDTPDAEVAVLLSPVYGETGESTTIFNKLNDETPFGFNDLKSFDGHIKVHQDGGQNKNVILAYGNIGRVNG